MTARAAIRQSDIARVMRAAKLEGMAGEIDMRSGVIRFFPANHRPVTIDATNEPDASALKQWQDRRNEGKALGRP
jgi:hypothetical protein